MPTSTERLRQALYDNAPHFGIELRPEHVNGLSSYYELLLKWNNKLHLVAPCTPEEFATRHLLESLFLLSQLPKSARLADVGSGGGLPIVPCLIVRDDLRVTAIESSQRKAVFLREAVRVTNSREPAQVLTARFEEIEAPEVDFVSCRALDKFEKMLPALLDWAPNGSELLLFTGANLRRQIEELIPSARVYPIPLSERRFLIGARASGA